MCYVGSWGGVGAGKVTQIQNLDAQILSHCKTTIKWGRMFCTRKPHVDFSASGYRIVLNVVALTLHICLSERKWWQMLEVLGAVCCCYVDAAGSRFSLRFCRWHSALGWQTHTCYGSGRLPSAQPAGRKGIRNPNNLHIALRVLLGQWRPSERAVERLWVLSGMGNERLCWCWCETL